MTARAVCSLANVAGIGLRNCFPICRIPDDLDKFNDLFLKVRNAGYEIVKCKGKTIYAARSKRFLPGSVSDDVCDKAKCSVLIVPAKT